MHRKAEEASEAEAEFEMERRGGRGFPLQVCSPCSTQGGRQRARQTRKAHSRGCAVRVRCEGGKIERAEHREHTHVGMFSVFDARQEAKGEPNTESGVLSMSGARGDVAPCLARGGTRRA